MIKGIELGADLISFGRPTIADPHMVQHLLEGKPIKCISCDKCRQHLLVEPVKCYAF